MHASTSCVLLLPLPELSYPPQDASQVHQLSPCLCAAKETCGQPQFFRNAKRTDGAHASSSPTTECFECVTVDHAPQDNGASARVTTMALPEVDAAAGGRPRGADVPLAADNRPLPEVRAHQPDRANGMERPEAAAAAIQPLPAAVPPAPPAPPSGPPLAPQPAVQNAPLKTSPPQRPAVPAGVSRRLQTFYYPWYATAEYDGAWKHWNHERITHWDARHAKKWSTHAHQ